MQPTPYETLMAAFLDTPEMADWDAFVSAARQQLEEACRRFLTNPVIEDYHLEIE